MSFRSSSIARSRSVARSRSIATEIGSAVAVLAVYLLVLLAPLHQAAGLQKDLAGLGYDSITNWTICTAGVATDSGQDEVPTAAKCPLAGIGKHELAAIEPGTIDVDHPRLATSLTYAVIPLGSRSQHPPYHGQARAPPVTV